MCVSDVGRVVELEPGGWARVADRDGSTRRISIAPLTLTGEEVAVGDWVLVHTGFAVERLSDAEATDHIAAITDLEQGVQP